jgi:hypothetical protein
MSRPPGGTSRVISGGSYANGNGNAYANGNGDAYANGPMIVDLPPLSPRPPIYVDIPASSRARSRSRPRSRSRARTLGAPGLSGGRGMFKRLIVACDGKLYLFSFMLFFRPDGVGIFG